MEHPASATEPVPKLLKTKWPEFIALSLGIATEMGSGGPWHSTGDTTDLAWFQRVAEALDVPYAANRVETMRVLVESMGVTWDPMKMSSSSTPSKGGGNLKVAAFEALWSGLIASVPGTNGLEAKPAMEAAQKTDIQESAREFVLRQIRLRRGQPQLRSELLSAYSYRCAITGSDVVETLEAAHITPFADGGPMHVPNGLLLRADIHTLFDLRLIAVSTADWQVLVHPKIAQTVGGSGLASHELRLPLNPAHMPSADRLDQHRLRSGL